jgi:hypothetical protein
VAGGDLQRAIREVARYRKIELIALRDVLRGYADLAQARWAAWRRRQSRDELPAQFRDVLAVVLDFAEPAIADDFTDMIWSPDEDKWS